MSAAASPAEARDGARPLDLAVIGAGPVGLALALHAAARPDLQRVLPQVELSLPVWLCMHEDLRHSAAHLAVFRALADGLRAPPPA